MYIITTPFTKIPEHMYVLSFVSLVANVFPSAIAAFCYRERIAFSSHDRCKRAMLSNWRLVHFVWPFILNLDATYIDCEFCVR